MKEGILNKEFIAVLIKYSFKASIATGNKLNCFISARGMLTIIWHCAFVL